MAQPTILTEADVTEDLVQCEGIYYRDYRILHEFNHQTYLMVFSDCTRHGDPKYSEKYGYEYNVCLQINTKRKNADKEMDNRAMTGLSPFVSIKFATTAFDLILNEVRWRDPKKPCTIRIYGADKRRYDIYEKFLKKKGFVVKVRTKPYNCGDSYPKYLEKVFPPVENEGKE